MCIPLKNVSQILLSVSFTTFCGCGLGGLGDRYTATQELSKSFSVKANPHVVVETFNGKLEVLAGPSESKVEAKVIKHASGRTQEAAEDNLEDISVSMEIEGNTVSVRAELVSEASFIGNRGAEVELQLPTGSVLDLTTSNGKITVTGPTGNVASHSSNGPITIKGAQGRVVLRSSNGPLKAEDVRGPMDLQTSNGKIEIASCDGVVKAQTSNGGILFKGCVAEGQHSFRTSNGSIDLVLPIEARFRLDAETSNSRVETDFPIHDRSEESDRTRLRGTVGENPTATIIAHTSNGRIKITQAK